MGGVFWIDDRVTRFLYKKDLFLSERKYSNANLNEANVKNPYKYN